MISFSNTEKKIVKEDISNIEEFVKLKFPNSYIQHLLKYNGGQCSPSAFTFLENGQKSNSRIDWFLAIYDGEYDNLKEYIETYKIQQKRLPSHILPIAHDPGGNLICISCGNEDNGIIYFWDHEKEVDYYQSDDNDYTNLYFIANNIEDLLNNLF